MKDNKEYLLALEKMPFPSYDALFGALHSMSVLLSGITSGKLEMTDDIYREILEVLEFTYTLTHMVEMPKYSEYLDKDNERFRKEIRQACDEEGVDYEEASAIIKANSEIGQRRFDQSVDKAEKEKN